MFDAIRDVDGASCGNLPPGSDLRRPWVRAFDELADEVGPAGRVLAALPGGRDLVEALRETEGWAWDAGSLVEVVAAYERVASWARAGAAAAAARLAERPEMNPSWPPDVGRPTESNGAPTELSLRLGVSRRAAATLVCMGDALRGLHHSTGDALAAGHVDWPRARVIVESLEHVTPAVALEVEDRVLPSAAGATTTQLRRQIARLLEEIDPEHAAERHGHARRKRCVTRPRALPDGMASMTATLTVDAAVRLDACLQAAADAARSDGDARSVDQLRADALDAMGEVAWATGFIGVASVGVPGVRPEIDPGAAGEGTGSDGPGAGMCTGPDVEGSGVGVASVGGSSTGGADDGARVGPTEGGPPTGRAEDVLPTGRAEDALPTGRAEDALPTGRAAVPGFSPGVAGGLARMSLSRRAGPPARVHVTVGYGTLLGLDDRPGELAGFGPVSADVARRLATQGTWRRLLVDEPSGTVMDLGTTRYAPPADMVELVRERNRTCVVPTCGMPARRYQTDHTVPFPRVDGRPATSPEGAGLDTPGRPEADGEVSSAQGRTAADNLGPLCATHHLFKTHGGFRLSQPRPGAFVVRTPSGHVYLQDPDRPPGVPEPTEPSSFSPPRSADLDEEPAVLDTEDGAEGREHLQADPDDPRPGGHQQDGPDAGPHRPEGPGPGRHHPWMWDATTREDAVGSPPDGEPPPL